MAILTEEQLNQMEYQKKQVEISQLHDKSRNRVEALRIVKDILIENQRTSSIEDRSKISVEELITGADSLVSFIHNPQDFK